MEVSFGVMTLLALGWTRLQVWADGDSWEDWCWSVPWWWWRRWWGSAVGWSHRDGNWVSWNTFVFDVGDVAVGVVGVVGNNLGTTVG